MGGATKRRILFASVLKPVNDTRMFEKMGLTLAATGEFEVIVAGFPGEAERYPGIATHSLPAFKRLSLKRLLMPWKILRLIFAVKPHVLVVATHELLLAGVVAKLFTRCALIYDIQENYMVNILYSDAFPAIIRPLLAYYVRLKESLLCTFADHFFLAERSYANELRFLRDRFTIIENKTRASAFALRRERQDQTIRLLFSGTLDEQTGVFNAIELAIKLHTISRYIRLIIAGYCPRQDVWFKIKNTVEPYAFIEVRGGDRLLPHSAIMNEIASADFGVVSYELTAATSGSIPTKLYEYLGARLPILLYAHKPWEELCKPCNAAIVIPRGPLAVREILDRMKHGSFYTATPEDVYWEPEGEKLVGIVRAL
jgi:glycosyltransferase involved in cell wall biosynthesis